MSGERVTLVGTNEVVIVSLVGVRDPLGAFEVSCVLSRRFWVFITVGDS